MGTPEGSREVRPRPTAPPGLEEFVHARSQALLRAAWLLTGNWAAAEDLVQTALTAAWTRWSSLDNAERYIHRVMLTTYLRWSRRNWTREVASADLPEDATAAAVDVEARSSVLAALRPLPRQQRAVVVLRYFLDLTEAQTAETLGISIGAVKTHNSRALARLRTNTALAAIFTGGETA